MRCSTSPRRKITSPGFNSALSVTNAMFASSYSDAFCADSV
jgi:hypothetical protein